MQAIIPLAGKGTRVRPHTHSRPKPLLRVANRPVLSYVIEQLQAEGVDELVLITGHLSRQIENFITEKYPNLSVSYVEQGEQLGTAHAVALAEPLVNGSVLIVFVDTLLDADFGVIHQKQEVDGIIWVKEVDDYQRYGVVLTDKDGYMERIVEKPKEPVSKLANVGVYFIRDYELMFRGIRHVIDQDPNQGEYFLTDAFQYMIDKGARLYTAEARGWFDCGTPETVLKTNAVMLERGHGGHRKLPDSVRVDGAVAVAEDATIEASHIGPNVSVAAGSTVRGSRLRNTIIGESSVVEDCDLEESLVGDQAMLRRARGRFRVGDHTHIEGIETDREKDSG